jgi:hypothetical protein
MPLGAEFIGRVREGRAWIPWWKAACGASLHANRSVYRAERHAVYQSSVIFANFLEYASFIPPKSQLPNLSPEYDLWITQTSHRPLIRKRQLSSTSRSSEPADLIDQLSVITV